MIILLDEKPCDKLCRQIFPQITGKVGLNINSTSRLQLKNNTDTLLKDSKELNVCF